MPINVPRQVPLRDPRSINLGIEKPLMEYLVQLNEWLQTMNRQVRDSLVSRGSSGTLILDDGANWRLTVTIAYGRITGVATSVSSGAACAWTPA